VLRWFASTIRARSVREDRSSMTNAVAVMVRSAAGRPCHRRSMFTGR
jgi:hypothetical protein